jgi:hypothetical protein
MRKTGLFVIFLIALAAALGPRFASAQEFSFHGQASAWFVLPFRSSAPPLFGLRYLPSLSFELPLSASSGFDAEFTANAYLASDINRSFPGKARGDVDPYRLWARLYGPRYEFRLGLQKLSFGAASLLRPLMWFDRLDPNDPLRLAEGVWGALARFWFKNEVNIWVWGLYGNDAVKGWEVFPTTRRVPELGARLEIPAGPGDLGLSFHHRRIDPARSPYFPIPFEPDRVPETRFGLDGKWDLEVGLWFEAVLIRQRFETFAEVDTRMFCLGADYTFGLGNGLNVMAEHLITDSSPELLSEGNRISFTAATVGYPLGLLDQVRAMVFHNWETGDWYRFLTWQRTYDRWSIHLIAFWNPESYALFNLSGASPFSGKGVEIVVVFNH